MSRLNQILFSIYTYHHLFTHCGNSVAIRELISSYTILICWTNLCESWNIHTNNLSLFFEMFRSKYIWDKFRKQQLTMHILYRSHHVTNEKKQNHFIRGKKRCQVYRMYFLQVNVLHLHLNWMKSYFFSFV